MRQSLPITRYFGNASSRLIALLTETLLPSTAVTRIRTVRYWRSYIDGLTANLLKDLTRETAHIKRELFQRYVNLVEIETHAKCNRSCNFCPNVDGNRIKNEKITDSAMLDRVFDELGTIDYRRQIKIARYSEPLSNPQHLYACINSARTRVPNAELAIVTNTDYL